MTNPPGKKLADCCGVCRYADHEAHATRHEADQTWCRRYETIMPLVMVCQEFRLAGEYMDETPEREPKRNDW